VPEEALAFRRCHDIHAHAGQQEQYEQKHQGIGRKDACQPGRVDLCRFGVNCAWEKIGPFHDWQAADDFVIGVPVGLCVPGARRSVLQAV
jgi:hypothetical protein